jgi:hypothetical protein
MLQRICLVLSVCALAFFFVGGLSQAGWSGLGLTSAHDASSLVISVKKHKHNDDDNDDDNGLEQCTIQKPGSGMGCVAPLKLKCEKMKNGQKCCGCVGDKNAKTQTQAPQTQTQQTQQAPAKKPGSYCSQPVPPSMEALAKQTCSNSHSGSWLNCEILTPGPNGTIRCCCNWME